MTTILADTSPAVAATEAPDFLTGLVLVHAAMRRDVDRLPAAIAAARTPARRALLHRWYAAFLAEVEHHHEREDDIVWPRLIERVPAFAGELPPLEDDHHRLGAALHGLEAALDQLATSTSGWTAPAVEAAEHLRTHLHAHLDREEAAAFPAFGRGFDADSFAALERELLAQTPKRLMAFELPWAMEGLDGDEPIELPFPIRVLNRLVFQPRYRRLAKVFGD